MKNKLAKFIDLSQCKRVVEETEPTSVAILVEHYSINIASRYEDGEELQADLDELEDELGCTVFVSQYDDLCADPHGVNID